MANGGNDPLFDDEPRSLVSRLLPPLVLTCAFGGFIALAIYAYKAGSQSVNEGDLMIIEADKTPMKEKPQDPGGMQFPNQDKTIFETFTAGNQAPPQVERVLPTPEEPMTKDALPTPPADDKATANQTTPQTTAPASVERVFGDDDAPPAVTQKTEENVAETGPKIVNINEELGKQAVAEAAPVVPEAPAQAVNLETKPHETITEKSTENPLVIEAVKSAEKTPVNTEVKKPAAKIVEKPKAAPEKKPAKQLVQLGAYKTEADARADFSKIQKKNAALAGKSPTINRADLGDKGVFYRLRVATDDAKKLCAALAGQACMAVK